jgi:imidazolonepropionase
MNLALINIKQLVTVASNGKRVKVGTEMRDLGIIENGAVMIENETITWVGRTEDLSIGNEKETDVVDCTNKVVLPGFVDSHTHLVFAGSREEEFAMRSAGATYQEIAERGGGILNTVRNVRAASKKELKKHARRHINNMLKQGTTVVEIKSGYGLDMDSEIKMLEAITELGREEVMTVVATFLGAHAIPPEFKENKAEYIRIIKEKMLPYIAERNLAEFCDVFCERGYFDLQETETILTSAKEKGLALKLHAEELSPLGGSELAARMNAISVDHLEHISEQGIKALADSQTVAVLLPGVSFFLNHQYAPARVMLDAGVPIAIATDFNPGSCMSYNMPLMMTIACTHMKMTPEETIAATTLNAAAAVNRSHEYGSIEPGKKANVVIFDIPDYKFLPYHFGENHVYRTIKHGVVLEF